MVDTDPGNQCNGNYNWIRLAPTVGGNFFTTWQFKWDIWDATQSMADTWMFYGDSITANGALVKDTDYDVTFAKQINVWNSNYYPAVEGGGMSGWTAASYLTDATTVDGTGDSSPWLRKTLAHFVVLGLGTNDCNSSFTDPYNLYATALSELVDAVMTDPADPSDPYTAGRVVIIPTLPASPALRSGTNTVQMWNSSTSSYQPTTVTGNGGGPACNQRIAQVIAAKQAQYGSSRVLAGPDLWSILSDPSVQWFDSLHPADDAQGDGIWRAAWVHWAEAHVYGSLIK
jgi:hypothetical protein